MKVTYHVEGKNAAELATGLRAHLAILESSDGVEAPAIGKPVRTSKPAKTAPAEDTFELDSEEPIEVDADEAEDEAEEAPSLEAAIEACRKYAKKYGNDKTIAKIKKVTGVGSVQKVAEDKRAELIAALKV